MVRDFFGMPIEQDSVIVYPGRGTSAYMNAGVVLEVLENGVLKVERLSSGWWDTGGKVVRVYETGRAVVLTGVSGEEAKRRMSEVAESHKNALHRMAQEAVEEDRRGETIEGGFGCE